MDKFTVYEDIKDNILFSLELLENGILKCQNKGNRIQIGYLINALCDFVSINSIEERGGEYTIDHKNIDVDRINFLISKLILSSDKNDDKNGMVNTLNAMTQSHKSYQINMDDFCNGSECVRFNIFDLMLILIHMIDKKIIKFEILPLNKVKISKGEFVRTGRLRKLFLVTMFQNEIPENSYEFNETLNLIKTTDFFEIKED